MCVLWQVYRVYNKTRLCLAGDFKVYVGINFSYSSKYHYLSYVTTANTHPVENKK